MADHNLHAKEMHVDDTMSYMCAACTAGYASTIVCANAAPALTSLAPTNAPAQADPPAVLSVSGTNFGSADFTPTVQIGLTICSTSSWITTSSVMCAPSQGSGSPQPLNVVVQGLQGTLSSAPRGSDFQADFDLLYDSPIFTYDYTGDFMTVYLTVVGDIASWFASRPAPELQNSNNIQLGLAQALAISPDLVTVAVHASGSIVLSITLPATTESALQQLLAPGTVTGYDGRTYTLVGGLSLDLPAPSSVLSPNGPTTGGNRVTLMGLGFGTSDPTPSVKFGPTLCSSNRWTSRTSISCVLPRSAGTFINGTYRSDLSTGLYVQVGSLIGTFLPGSFTYDGNQAQTCMYHNETPCVCMHSRARFFTYTGEMTQQSMPLATLCEILCCAVQPQSSAAFNQMDPPLEGHH